MKRRDRANAAGNSGRMAGRTAVRTALLLTVLGAAAVLAASCAGPKKLTEQSEKALAEGEVDRAYEKARSALRKAPDNERARRALGAAAERKMTAMKGRVRAVAGARDTVAAAGYCLDIDEFRREIAEYSVAPKPDPAFDREGAAIRHAAARRLVADAEDALAGGNARGAYGNVERARQLESAYPGLDRLRDEAYAQAIHRIAIIPFENQTEVRGLGTELTDEIHREVTGGLNRRNFPFTLVLPREDVYARVSLAEAENLDRREAVELGRDLDADYIVRGRVYGLTSETTTDSWHPTVYHRHREKDEGGREVDRYSEARMSVTGRMRRVTVHCDFEVRSTRDGSLIAEHSDAMRAAARVIYTDFRGEGDPDDYTLAPPGMRKSNPRDVESRERDWKGHCGTWELPALLERAKREPKRSYRSSIRKEFYADTESRPVFLTDLPPADDLAFVALKDAWKPVLETLRRVER
jgi:TolB-like protein